MKRFQWYAIVDPFPTLDDMPEYLYQLEGRVDDIYWQIPIFEACVGCWSIFREW